jgi:hypothetical protein
MVAVGRQLHQAAVVDVRHQTARRFTDPAERAHFPHGGIVGDRSFTRSTDVLADSLPKP